MKTQAVIVAVVVLAVVVPFLIAGQRIEAYSLALVSAARAHPMTAAWVVILLLTADVVLPVPASVVMTSSGALLGFAGGTLCSVAGMTLGCVCGYGLGAWTSGTARRMAGEPDMQKAVAMFARYGDWAVVAGRAVPIVAEATTVYAGLYSMPFWRFLALTALANTGTSIVYAAVGAYAADVKSFLFAFVATLLLPLGPMLWWRHTVGSRAGVPETRRAVHSDRPPEAAD